MSVDSGSAGMAARLGIKTGMVVQELGWDEDADEDLRDSIVEASGSEMVDEDTDEVADVVLLWWREDDGDLFDALTDALTSLAEDRKSTRLNSSHANISYAVFCLKNT